MNVLSLFDNKYILIDNGTVISNVGTPKELIGKITNSGYREVLLTVKGKRLYKTVHRLIAENFISNPKNLSEVNHKDGNKTNNNISNLEWTTSQQNQIHSRNVLKNNCKINMSQANKIRKLYNTGDYSYKSLGVLFGLKKHR